MYVEFVRSLCDGWLQTGVVMRVLPGSFVLLRPAVLARE